MARDPDVRYDNVFTDLSNISYTPKEFLHLQAALSSVVLWGVSYELQG